MALLRAAGLRGDADRTYRALWHLLFGHLLNEHPLGHLHGNAPDERDFPWSLRRLLAGALAQPRR